MKALLIIPILLLFKVYTLQAQHISGQVNDQKGRPVYGAVIQGVSEDFRVLAYASSDAEGSFLLESKNYSYIVSSHISFYSDTLVYNPNSQGLSVVLVEKSYVLDELVVVDHNRLYRNNNDTSTYTVDSFSDGHERNIEDVLKKLPGVKVDDKGTIFLRGKMVSEVLIEEDDLFGSGYALGTKSMKPEFVEEFEFIDNYNEESITSNFIKSDKLVLNLKLKEEFKLSVFGDGEMGLGSPKKHLVRGNIFSLARQHKMAIFGNLNNVAYERFSLLDYLHSGQAFDNLNYNRSIDRIASRGVIPVAGLPFELQVNSNNKYLTANQIVGKGKLRSEVRITGSAANNSLNDKRSINYLGQNDIFHQSYHDTIQNKGISLFNESVYQIDSHSKIKLRFEWVMDNNKGLSIQQLGDSNTAAKLSYSTPGNKNSVKANVEYLRKINENLAMTFNYSRIEERISEVAQNTIDGESSGRLAYNNYVQKLSQGLKDHVTEFGLLHANGKRKSVYKTGVKFISDQIYSSRTTYGEDTIIRRESYDRDYYEPFVLSNHQYEFSRKSSLIIKSEVSAAMLAYGDGGLDDMLYDFSVGYKNKISSKFLINSFVGHKSRIIDALSTSDIAYFSSFNSYTERELNINKIKSTNALMGMVYSEPKKLIEAQGSVYYSIRSVPGRIMSINGLQTKSEYAGIVNQPTISSNINVDKYVKMIRSNISIDASYFWLKNIDQYKSYNEFITQNKKVGLTLSTNTIKFISLNISHSINQNEISGFGMYGASTQRRNTYLRAQYGTKLYPLNNDDLQLELKSDIYTTLDAFNFGTNNFTSLMLSYNLGKQSNLSFTWKNILNKQEYLNIEVNPFTIEGMSSTLQPSFAYITFNKKFSL